MSLRCEVSLIVSRVSQDTITYAERRQWIIRVQIETQLKLQKLNA